MGRIKRLSPVLLIVILVMALLAGCSCVNPLRMLFGSKISKEDIETMNGTWVLVAGGTKDNIKSAKDLGRNESFVFGKDGNAVYAYDGKSDEYTWEKIGETVLLKKKDDKTGTDSYTITIEGDTFKLYKDEQGQNMELVFARKGTAATDPSKYITATQPAPQIQQGQQTQPAPQTTQPSVNSSISYDSLVGVYEFTERLYNGKWWSSYDSELFDTYLSLRADGSFMMGICLDTYTGIYEWDGSSLSLVTSASADGVMNTTVEGNTITVYNPQPGNPSIEALKFVKR